MNAADGMHESLSDGVPDLNTAKAERLRKFCADQGLTGPVIAKVERAARLIQGYQERDASRVNTPEGLVCHLGDVVKKAGELHALVVGLSHFDQSRLHGEMIAAAVDDGRLQAPRKPSAGEVRAIAHDVAELGKAAQALRAEVDRGRKGGGRKKTSHGLEMCVELVQEAVADEGWTVGRGGPFHRLCDAVFEAAGVPSTAEGAIRKLVAAAKAQNAPKAGQRKAQKAKTAPGKAEISTARTGRKSP